MQPNCEMAVTTAASHMNSTSLFHHHSSPQLVQSSNTIPPSLLYLPRQGRSVEPFASIAMSIDVGSNRPASRCFTSASGSKSFDSSVSVSEINMFNGADSLISSTSSPKTPNSPFSMEKRARGFAETEKLISQEPPSPTSHSRSGNKPSRHRRRNSKTPSKASTVEASSKPSSRRSSVSNLRPCSRRNSFLLNRSVNIPSTAVPPRRSSATKSSGGSRKDLISFHQHSCRLFQSLGGALAENDPSSPVEDMDRNLLADQSWNRDSFSKRSTPHSSRPPSSGGEFSSSSPTRKVLSAPALARSYSMPYSKLPVTFAVSSESASHDHTYSSSPTSSNRPSFSASDNRRSSAVPSPNLDSREFETDARRPSTADPFRPVLPTTVMTWTSTETRRREYAKIDRAHSGFRGAWKKVVPSWMRGRGARTAFFEEGRAESDCGSVRRFRMDLNEDAEEDGGMEQTCKDQKNTKKSGTGLKKKISFLNEKVTASKGQGYKKKILRGGWSCLNVTANGKKNE